jgi:hypothetical protein
MRPAIKRGTVLLGCCLLMMSAGMAAAQTTPTGATVGPQCVATVRTAVTPAGRPVPQQVYTDARTGASFFFTSTGEGAVRLMVKAGELDMDKVIHRDGRSRIVLKAGDDRVSVAVDVTGVDVERRGAGRAQLDVARATEAEWLQVKVLLAGSKALRLFRALASNLDASTLKTPGGAAVVLSDAILGHLDGDVGAVDRLQQQFRAAVRARIRPVRMAAAEEDCWHRYEEQVTHAADDYDNCRHTFYWYDPRQAACAFVWSLQAESAWGQLLACSSIALAVG